MAGNPKKKETVTTGSRAVELSRPDKVLFPASGLTKRDIVEYYRRIAGRMLPHLKDRPLTMHRYPDGIRESGFYEKKAPDYFPNWIERVTVSRKGGKNEEQVLCQNKATLLYLADQACLTPHIWLSRKKALERPDRMIFDLDPVGKEFAPLKEAARRLKELLEKTSLTPYVMTTGSRGLHVVTPLDGSSSYREVRAFARKLARRLCEANPAKYTVETRRKKRKGRLFIDYLRNAYGQTAVCPYAVRVRRKAPVATPLSWDELGRKGLQSSYYTVENIFKRTSRKEDPWKGMDRHRTSLAKAAEKLDRMA